MSSSDQSSTPLEASNRLQQLLDRDYQRRASEDAYRGEWSWDSTVKVVHSRANCDTSCSLVAFVKDGKVWREEQNALYEQTTPDVPDFNPRGCAGGCIYSTQMYDPTRIKYPVKRNGPRGGGEWERITWDQALEEIADKLLDVAVEHGPECLVYENAPNTDIGLHSGLEAHLLGEGIGGVTLDIMSGTGDLPTGLLQMWGIYLSEGTADDWFHTDYIINWIGNPAYTHQADIHFQYEARYKGTKLVSIAPDFSPSTVHSDLWLNVRIGTDAALALGMVNVILQERLYKSDYIKEQTDLPFLVRTDTGRFLRAIDVEEDGSADIFYFWNANTGRKVEAPGTWGAQEDSIALDEGVDPALEGEHRVRLKDGRRVKVRTVFELVRERAAEYTLERVEEITGVAASNIARVAREFAAANSAMVWTSWGAAKLFHSDLYVRGMAYLTALTGHSGGKPGNGIRTGAFWPAPFGALMSQGMMGGNRQRLNTEPVPDSPMERISMMMVQKVMGGMTATSTTLPLIPFLYVHDPEYRAVASRQEYNDPALKRSVDEYMQECMENGWQPVWPKPPKRPRFLWFSGDNPLRRWPNPGIIRRSFWQSLDTIVAFDFRWNTSVLWADYVLPAAGWYEKPATKYYMSYTHHIHVGEEAVAPLYDSKNEFDVVMLLAKKVQERALVRDIEEYTDPFGRTHNPKTLYDDMTADGVYAEGPEGIRNALDFMLKNSATTRNNDLGENFWEAASEMGGVKPVAIKPSSMIGGVHSDYAPDRTISPMGWFTEMKNSWPTLTGRQQFLIDHDWFFEAGETLLVHKEPPSAGGKYPIRLTGGHNRNSIHSTQMALAPMLQLQRGEPAAYISVEDAKARGVEDGDRIRVFNDLASFEIIAKVAPATRPGMITVYNAWEGYQFKEWHTQNDLQANPPKPTCMVGGYGQLQYRPGGHTMNHIPKEVACDFEKAGG